MRTLPHHLYIRSRGILLRCSEFEADHTLKAVFVTDDLQALRLHLPMALSKADRVDQTLAYLLEKEIKGKTPALVVFLRVLRDRYEKGDELHHELTRIYNATQHALAHPGVCSEVNPTVLTPDLDNPSLETLHSQLERLLRDQHWREADLETGRLLLQLAGLQAKQWDSLTASDIQKIVPSDLQRIDQLWMQESRGRFGFSVQYEIWQSVNGNFDLFCDLVGWRVLKTRRFERKQWWQSQIVEENYWEMLEHHRLTFGLHAPRGHLPFGSETGIIWRLVRGRLATLAERLA